MNVPCCSPVPPGRPFGAARRGLSLLALLAGLSFGCSPPEHRRSLHHREQVFEVLGATVARLAPGSPVVVVKNPFASRPGADPSLRTVEEASVRGLRRGLGTPEVPVSEAAPELKPGALENPRAYDIPPGATTPISFLSAEGAWDRLPLPSTPPGKTPVLVSLIGLPADLATTRAWTDPQGPGWVLYLPDLRILGNTEALRAAFRGRRILALVLARPGAPPELEAPAGDARAEFERRYLLVTAESLESILREWPRLFSP